MSQNILRSTLHKLGLDIHRYHEEPGIFAQFKALGIDTVLDIGANVGQFAKEARAALPDAQIISFEPIKECFDQLTRSFANDSKFKAFNFALGPTEGTLTMNKSAYTPSSSLLPMAKRHQELFPHTKEHTSETVEIKRLDDVLRNEQLGQNILIKIDVQGYEDKVIAGGPETFRKARTAIIENSFSPFYEGQPLFDDIYETMKNLGFSYRSNLHQKKDRKTGEVLFEDSIFVRNN